MWSLGTNITSGACGTYFALRSYRAYSAICAIGTWKALLSRRTSGSSQTNIALRTLRTCEAGIALQTLRSLCPWRTSEARSACVTLDALDTLRSLWTSSTWRTCQTGGAYGS